MSEDWESQLKPHEDWEAQLKPVAHKEAPGKIEAFGRGAAQGATLGYGDELAGAWNTLTSLTGNMSPGRAYKKARDETRTANAEAETAHPGFYLGGQVLGGAAPTIAGTIATGGAAALPIALGEGAASGAGFSDAKDLGGLARDAGAGLAVGGVGYGLGSGLGYALKGLARKAGQKAGAAAGRAAEKAAAEVAAEQLTAKGELGAETQKGSRYVENLMRLKESMTPEQLAAYEQLHSEGVIPELQQSVAQNTLEALPAQSGKIAAKRTALETLNAAAPQMVEDRTAALRTPQFGKDALSYAKSYAEPLVAAYLAGKGADLAGLSQEHKLEAMGAVGLMAGRTRAGKALMSRLTRPGNAEAIWNAISKSAQLPTQESGLGQALRAALRGSALVPATAAASGAFDTRDAQDEAIAQLKAKGIPVVGIPTPHAPGAQ